MIRRILWIVAALSGVCLVLTFGVNRFFLSVTPRGEEYILLEYGTEFDDPGADVWFRGSLFCREGFAPESAAVTVDGEVDSGALGRYTLRYRADFLWFTAEGTRTVTVADTKSPVITLKEDGGEIPIPYQEAGFSAWDDHDGDITHRVVRREYMGLITYAVTDSSGNPAYIQRQVPFHDPIPPEITLEGGTEYAVPVGQRYSEPGFWAVDNVDGDLTEWVVAEGRVDWLRPGVYPIVYSVTDSYENTARIIRNVTVTAAERQETVWPEEKTIYLSFDDGPGPYTEKLLDVLDRYGVKATFFVVDSEYNHLMKQITERGHSIGIHSVTHDYGAIYASPEAFFDDLVAMRQIIFDNTGVLTNLMRFPGGSSNEVSRESCEGIMTFLTGAVRDAGFRYFDWNVDSDDAGLARRKGTVLENVVRGVTETGTALVLQHDIHWYSVEAVEEIIRWGLENGYAFLPLEESSPNFPHPLNN